jgi:hypothetical protein
MCMHEGTNEQAIGREKPIEHLAMSLRGDDRLALSWLLPSIEDEVRLLRPPLDIGSLSENPHAGLGSGDAPIFQKEGRKMPPTKERPKVRPPTPGKLKPEKSHGGGGEPNDQTPTQPIRPQEAGIGLALVQGRKTVLEDVTHGDLLVWGRIQGATEVKWISPQLARDPKVRSDAEEDSPVPETCIDTCVRIGKICDRVTGYCK